MKDTMRFVIFEEHKLLLFITQKCANTSIRAMFKLYISRLNENVNVKNVKVRQLCKMKYHTNQINNDFKKYENYKKIFICRNPYLKLVSYYVDKHVMNDQKRLYFNKVLKDISFRELVNILFEKVKKNDFWLLYSHKRLQAFKDIDKIKFDKIIKIEDGLGEQLRTVFSENGVPEDIINDMLSIPFKNRTAITAITAKTTGKNGKLSSITSSKLKNIPNDYSLFYDKDLKEKVYHIYKPDFIFFGYDKNNFSQ